jgi:hypothetical protein
MAKLYAAQHAPQLRQGFLQAMGISDGEGNGESFRQAYRVLRNVEVWSSRKTASAKPAAVNPLCTVSPSPSLFCHQLTASSGWIKKFLVSGSGKAVAGFSLRLCSHKLKSAAAVMYIFCSASGFPPARHDTPALFS